MSLLTILVAQEEAVVVGGDDEDDDDDEGDNEEEIGEDHLIFENHSKSERLNGFGKRKREWTMK